MGLFTPWLHLPCPLLLLLLLNRVSPVLVHAKNDKIALWRKITASFFPNAVFSSPAEEDEICSRIQINKKLSFKLLGDVKNKACQIPFLGNASGKSLSCSCFGKLFHLFTCLYSTLASTRRWSALYWHWNSVSLQTIDLRIRRGRRYWKKKE